MEKNVLNEIHNNGFAIVKNAFSKKLVNDLFDDLKKLSQVKMRSTNSTNLIDSKLIINPHSQSVNYLKVINSKIIENYCLNFLNDKFYKIINKKLPNYCLNHSIVRSSGKEALNLHRDDRNPPSNSKEICYLQFGLAIDDSNKANGCTIVIPKSHKKKTYVTKSGSKKKKYIEIKKGDLLIYDGRIWHGAEKNKSNKTRWMFFFGFARWHLRQTYDFPKDMNKKILKTLSKKDILKLGFHAITKLNEKKSGTASQRGDLRYAIANHKKILNI
jgi:ectoine hydroxylase-related dioxygenase (phytanoyl-CoA dioxygenase family)